MAYLDTKFECTYCHQRFRTRRQLRYHVDEAHPWVPKRCDEEGCDSTEVFENSMKYNLHKTKQHTVRFSTRCLFPRCTSSSAYNTQEGYSAHLSRSHGLPTAAGKRPYYPATKEHTVNVLLPCRCHLEGCITTVIFKDAWEFKERVIGTHNHTTDQANKLR